MTWVAIVLGVVCGVLVVVSVWLGLGLGGARGMVSALRGRVEELEGALAGARAEAEARGRAEGALREELAGIRVRLESAEEMRRRLEEDRERLKETFKSLAGDVLRSSSEDFLKLARERLGAVQQAGAAELEQRKSAVEQLVKPIGEALKQTHERLVALAQRVDDTGKASEALKEETARLARALSRPEVRGQYGEIQLRRVVELAGMEPYCDFSEQVSVRGADGELLRPDLVVRLPNERVVAVDAKTNTYAYIEAVNASDEEERSRHLERFAGHVAEQARRLGEKRYWAAWEGSPEFVVMFVPGDHFIDAALSRRPEILEDAASRGVLLAGPATLIGLLRAVAVGWREHRVAEEARALVSLGQELHERAARLSALLTGLGRSLEQAVERYNKVVGSYQSRLVPTLRRFEEMGVRSGKEVQDGSEVVVRARLPMGSEGVRAEGE